METFPPSGIYRSTQDNKEPTDAALMEDIPDFACNSINKIRSICKYFHSFFTENNKLGIWLCNHTNLIHLWSILDTNDQFKNPWEKPFAKISVRLDVPWVLPDDVLDGFDQSKYVYDEPNMNTEPPESVS